MKNYNNLKVNLKNSIKYEVKSKFVETILYTVTLNPFDKCMFSSYRIVFGILIFLTYIGHSCYDISMHIYDKNVFMFNVFVYVYIHFVYILFVHLWLE